MSDERVDRGQHGVLKAAAATAAEAMIPVEDVHAVDHSRRRDSQPLPLSQPPTSRRFAGRGQPARRSFVILGIVYKTLRIPFI